MRSLAAHRWRLAGWRGGRKAMPRPEGKAALGNGLLGEGRGMKCQLAASQSLRAKQLGSCKKGSAVPISYSG
jgi:hypothetical protein